MMPALERQKQDVQCFKSSLSYIKILTWAKENLSQKRQHFNQVAYPLPLF